MPLDDNSTGEQALIMRISQETTGSAATVSSEKVALFEEHLYSTLAESELGVLDGNEFDGCTWTLYLYGPNADALFEVAARLARLHGLSEYCSGTKRYGGPGSAQTVSRLLS